MSSQSNERVSDDASDIEGDTSDDRESDNENDIVIAHHSTEDSSSMTSQTQIRTIRTLNVETKCQLLHNCFDKLALGLTLLHRKLVIVTDFFN